LLTASGGGRDKGEGGGRARWSRAFTRCAGAGLLVWATAACTGGGGGIFNQFGNSPDSTNASGDQAQGTPTVRPAANGDIDGDGQPDKVTIQGAGTASQWIVTAAMTTLGKQNVTVQGGTNKPVLLGVVDAADDGHGSIFLQVTPSYATAIRLVGTQLHQLMLAGKPLQLSTARSFGSADSFGCDNPDPMSATPSGELVTSSAVQSDGTGEHWHVTTAHFAFNGADVVPQSTQIATFATADLPQLSCGSLPPAVVFPTD
jgi:hypothetical protein